MTAREAPSAVAAHPRLGALSLLMQQTREPPKFADAGAVVRQAFRDILFPEKVTPWEAANRHRNLRNPGGYSGPWRDSPESVAMAREIRLRLEAEGVVVRSFVG